MIWLLSRSHIGSLPLFGDVAFPMSSIPSGGHNGRRAMPAAYKVGLSALAAAPCAPGDERCGDYSREQLLRMDAEFCAAVERAISAGLERPQDGKARAA